MMSHLGRPTADRIRAEMMDLERAVKLAQRAWEDAGQADSDYNPHLDSAALNMHGLYSGRERLFVLIARHGDRTSPSGDMWHRTLLEQMRTIKPR